MGVFLLNNLLELPEVKSVVCLVRFIDVALGLSRVVRKCKDTIYSKQSKHKHKLLFTVGDLGKLQLGMSE